VTSKAKIEIISHEGPPCKASQLILDGQLERARVGACEEFSENTKSEKRARFLSLFPGNDSTA